MSRTLSENDKKLIGYDLIKLATELDKVSVALKDTAELLDKFPRYYINSKEVLDDASIELADINDKFFTMIQRM